MNEGLKKFEELLKTDAAFQGKMKAAMENYTGERTEQAVFEAILVPLANEHGISASYEEFQEYIRTTANGDKELNDDEIDQVAGGTKGFGASACSQWGFGLGFVFGEGGSGCIGLGNGGTNACAGSGVDSGPL